MIRPLRFQIWAMACCCALVSLLSHTRLVAQSPGETDIDRYVKEPDPAYKWNIVSSTKGDGATVYVVNLISQKWLTPEEVDRTTWQHWMSIVIPDGYKSDVGLLMIGGGRNGGDPPNGISTELLGVARATNAVVAELKMVPNQPLIFHGDGVPRVEDDLIGYTWDQYIKTGESRWLARNPMVKSAVRALDTITALSEQEGDGPAVKRFVVAGGSKRGWTTWLTGAMDDRVVAIVPIVIDVLNTDASMRHHFAAYGYWAPAIGNYVQHNIMQRMDDPRLEAAFKLVDPYSYRDRLDMPKLILNAAGDQFFLPDSSRFYWQDLIGEKHLRYVPNTDHGMDGSDAIQTLVSFFWCIVNDTPRPEFDWTMNEDGILTVTSETAPAEVRLWQATNSAARDFRLETLGPRYESALLKPNDDGSYTAKVDKPDHGWTAYFVELTYDVGGPLPLKFTTNVYVNPDTLPYDDRAATNAPSVTLRCQFDSSVAASQAVRAIGELVKQSGANLVLRSLIRGEVAYLNWVPNDARSEAGQLQKWLDELACEKVNIQLESGPNITVSETPE